jgi:oxygen-dependent protoporphyrinogen oxidase
MNKLHDVIIVGSGLSGLAVAHFLEKVKPGADIVLLEKNSRPGGAISSFSEKGFLAEWGPHGFLDNIAESRELLQDTGLDQEAQKAHLAEFVRYICLDSKLRLIPQSPKKILASSLVSLPAKLRVLADLWKKPQPAEQTVSDWVAYRFGAALVPFADAVFTGTYAGDIERLSIDAVMPGVRRVELETGSVIRGLLKKRKEKKDTPRGLPAMISFPQGMARLTEALAEDKDIQLDTAVSRISYKEGQWEVRAGDEVIQAHSVVLALSVNQTLSLLAESGLTPPQEKIPEAHIANVVMGFTKEARIPFGFGYLAPEQEKRFSMGALFSTHMFPGRAPEGHVMLEALIGGRRHPDKLKLSDDELVRLAYEDIGQLIDLPKPPCFAKVLRPPHGIPQLETGFPKLLAWRDSMEREQQGLYISGFGWGGIGINDMIKSAKRVALDIERDEAGTGEKAPVKGIYF